MAADFRYIALLHYPVYNKRGEIITTAVTNMDIHDISRSARTYGMRRFFIVTPSQEQQEFVGRILHHWQKGHGSVSNPSRKEAFDIVSVASSLDDVMECVAADSGRSVRLAVTSASSHRHRMSSESLREEIAKDNAAWVLLFGTGWGCAAEVIERADVVLDPIRGPWEYNHLSVRSAVAVMLDRLWGVR